jgi:hypothetical protein
MNPLPYKHFFTIVNGKFVWEDKNMLDLQRKLLEGKRGYAIIEEEVDKASSNQLAYYFGGIIRRECMNSNTFSGMGEMDIHNHLLLEVMGTVRSIILKNGETKLVNSVPDFNKIKDNKKKMTEYLEKLIPHLAIEYDIHVKPASMYKYNKFYIKTKIIE